MIDWLGFVVVAIVTLVGAGFVVTMYSLGVRLTAVGADDGGQGHLGARIGSWVCFGLCGLIVLMGIVLIVPVFYKTAMSWFGVAV